MLCKSGWNKKSPAFLILYTKLYNCNADTFTRHAAYTKPYVISHLLETWHYPIAGFMDKVETYYGSSVRNRIDVDTIKQTQFLWVNEWHLYGSSRLGIYEAQHDTVQGAVRNYQHRVSNDTTAGNYFALDTLKYYKFGKDSSYYLYKGLRRYEGANHLGNVLVVFTDKRIKVCMSDTVVYYRADVVNAYDYSPFGAPLAERTWSSDTTLNYRFGFNGKENDNEVKGNGNQQDYGMRVHDTRLGRFLSVDPIAKTFPFLTPYQFASDCPILNIDIDGLEGGAAPAPGSGGAAAGGGGVAPIIPAQGAAGGGTPSASVPAPATPISMNSVPGYATFTNARWNSHGFIPPPADPLDKALTFNEPLPPYNLKYPPTLNEGCAPPPWLNIQVITPSTTAAAATPAANTATPAAATTPAATKIAAQDNTVNVNGGITSGAQNTAPTTTPVTNSQPLVLKPPPITITMYRGVCSVNPMGNPNPAYTEALKGNAIPLGGHSNPELHCGGNTFSSFTSWSMSYGVASEHALLYSNTGIVLVKEFEITELVPSPCDFNELESLVAGNVTGAQTKPPLKTK